MQPDAHWLERAKQAARLRLDSDAFSLELLPPHGSLRRYVRVRRHNDSWMLMLLPSTDAISSEGGTSLDYDVENDPFIAVAAWLQAASVRAPRVYGVDAANRGIWLEDLGETHFQEALQAPRFTRSIGYQNALALLAAFQSASQRIAPPPFTALKALDYDLLYWELEHYVDWRLERRLGVTLSPTERQQLDHSFAWLARALVELPQITVHRDFQSHNIMATPSGELALIDFQDALQGPLPYDAVALLRDSYIVLQSHELHDLLQQWANQTRENFGAEVGEPAALIRAFHLQTVQRKLKDTGRFDLFDLQQGKPGYLQYQPDSIAYVHHALSQLDAPELDGLRQVLSIHEPLFSV